MSVELDILRAVLVADATQIVNEVRQDQRTHPQIKRLLLEADSKPVLDKMKLERRAYEIAVRIAVENLKQPADCKCLGRQIATCGRLET